MSELLDFEMKKAIVDVCKMMSAKGLVGTYEGNVSYRKGDKIFLTPTTQSKDLLTEGKIIAVDPDGKVIEGCLKGTSETPMHTAILKMRPDMNSVVHCHAPYCTAYALLNKPIECKCSPEFMILFGKVPVVPYGTPGTDEIYQGMEEYLQDYDVVLLANHGMIAVGKDPMEAYSKCLSLEMLMHTITIARSIPGECPVDLPEEDCARLIKMGEGRHGAPKK